jgi:hypothetical protein
MKDGGGDFENVYVDIPWESVGPSLLLAVDGQLVEAFSFRRWV